MKKQQYRDVLGNQEVVLLFDLHIEMFVTVGIFPLGNHLLKSRRNSSLEQVGEKSDGISFLFQKDQNPFQFVQQPCPKHWGHVLVSPGETVAKTATILSTFVSSTFYTPCDVGGQVKRATFSSWSDMMSCILQMFMRWFASFRGKGSSALPLAWKYRAEL